MTRGVFVLGSFLAFSCVPSVTNSGDSGVFDQPDAGEPDAGELDAGVTCGPDSRERDGGGCTQSLRWAPVAALPAQYARDHHATFAFTVGEQHFVGVTSGMSMGGSAFFTDTWTAPFSRDAGLGTWTQQPLSTLSPLTGGGVVVSNGRVYLVAGIDDTGDLSTAVVSASLGAGGSVGEWRAEYAIDRPARYHNVAFTLGADICTAGGFDGRRVFGDMQCATPGADGRLGPWFLIGTLQQPRSHFAVATIGPRTYVIGGFNDDGDGVLAIDVLTRAPNGMLSWSTSAASLPSRHRTHSVAVLGRALFLLNGEDGDAFSLGNAFDGVLRAEVDAAGNVSDWESVGEANPFPRRHTHQSPAVDGTIVTCLGTDANHEPLSNCAVAYPY